MDWWHWIGLALLVFMFAPGKGGGKSLRGRLYDGARFLGDVNAVSRGPGAIARRLVRKVALRKGGGAVNRSTR